MAYMRDPDRATRGVGAIASVDNAVPAAKWRRRQIGRALLRRDRAMSAVAMGALGSLHRVDPPKPPPTSATFTAPDGSKTVIHDHRTNPQPITAPAAPFRPVIDPLRVPSKDESGVLIYTKPKPPPTRTRLPPAPAAPGAPPPPPAAVLPPLVPSPTTPGQPGQPAQPGTPAAPGAPAQPMPTPGSGTVGSGGSSLPTTPGVAPPPGFDLSPVPQLPDQSVTDDGGTTKMLLIAGGAALLAFLIFRHQGDS